MREDVKNKLTALVASLREDATAADKACAQKARERKLAAAELHAEAVAYRDAASRLAKLLKEIS